MLKIRNCFIPWQVLQLAELRAGMSHILLLYVFFTRVCYPGEFTLWGILRNTTYLVMMFWFQRRLASGFPLRYLSRNAYRSSKDGFRRVSKFLREIRAAAPPAPVGAANSGLSGERPVAVLTGGERGIGFEVAKQLCRLDIDVVMCCPFAAEAERAMASIKKHLTKSRSELRFVELNLADESSIRGSAKAILAVTSRIDILINNAGILSNSGPRRANARGDELVLAINFLGPVLLTELLLPHILASPGPARIVNVASLMELNANVPSGYTPLSILKEHCRPDAAFYAPNYSLSKLLMICYTRDLARRLQGTRVTTATLHPGVVFTNIYDGWGYWSALMRAVLRTVFKFPTEGAEVVLYCAIADLVRSGGFYADCELHDNCVSPLASDAAQNQRITEFVCEHFNMTPHTIEKVG